MLLLTCDRWQEGPLMKVFLNKFVKSGWWASSLIFKVHRSFIVQFWPPTQRSLVWLYPRIQINSKVGMRLSSWKTCSLYWLLFFKKQSWIIPHQWSRSILISIKYRQRVIIPKSLLPCKQHFKIFIKFATGKVSGNVSSGNSRKILNYPSSNSFMITRNATFQKILF